MHSSRERCNDCESVLGSIIIKKKTIKNYELLQKNEFNLDKEYTYDELLNDECVKFNCKYETVQKLNDAIHKMNAIQQIYDSIITSLDGYNQRLNKVVKYEAIDIKFLYIISLSCNSHLHFPEDIKKPLSSIEMQGICIAISRFYVDNCVNYTCEGDVSYSKLPSWMRIGTVFKNITNLDYAGVAQFINHGYLTLESFFEINKEYEKDKMNKDVLAWKMLAESNIIQPRALDIYHCFFSLLIKSLTYKYISPLLLEACVIISSLSDGNKFPWVMGSRGKSAILTDKAAKAPVMMGAYFQDIITFEFDRINCMFNDNIEFNKFIDFRRGLLKKGYFHSILQVKKIKEIIINLTTNNEILKTIIVSSSMEMTGMGKKKSQNINDSYDSTIKILDEWPYLKTIIYKTNDNVKIVRNIVSLLHVTTSRSFLWRDLAITAIESQWSKFGGDAEPVTPKMIDVEDDYVYKYKPNTDMTRKISSYFEGLPQVKNMESKFYQSITTNSHGALPSDILSSKESYPKVLRRLLNSKIGIISFAPEIILNPHTFLDAIHTNTKLTFRLQILRRNRIVEGVGIGDQTIFAAIKKVFDLVMERNDSFNPGKTTGGVLDAQLILMGSGTPTKMCSYSDISGFDSSDPRWLQHFVRTEAVSCFDDYKLNNPTPLYFCMTPQRRKVFVDDNSECGKIMTEKEMSPIEMGLKTLFLVTKGKYIANDDRTIATSLSTLASGAYDTTGQGTVVSAAMGDTAKDNFPHMNIIPKGAGDDFQAVMDYIDFDRESTAVSEYIKKEMLSLGFTVENNFSTVYSEFLQISALCGQILSACYRLSPFTAERFERKHPLEMYGAMYGILSEMKGRVHYLEGLTQMTYILSYVCSNIKVTNQTTDTKRRRIHDSTYISLPQLYFLIRYNIPFPGYYDQSHFVNPSSMMAYGGDTKYLELYMLLFGILNKNELYRLDKALFKYVINKLKKDNINMFNPKSYNEFMRAFYKYSPLINFTMKRLRTNIMNNLHVLRALHYLDINISVTPDSRVIDVETKEHLKMRAMQTNANVDKQKHDMSETAFNKLKVDFGIDLPEKIVASRQTVFKLFDVFTASMMDEAYWTYIISKIDMSYTYNKRHDFKYYFSKWINYFNCSLDFLNVDVDFGIAPDILQEFVPTPPTMFSIDASITMARRGTYTTPNGLKLSKLDRATHYDYLDNNIEIWNRVINDVLRLPTFAERQGAIMQIVKAVGLNIKEERVLRELIDGKNSSPGGVFQITVDPKAQYWLSDDPMHVISRTSRTSFNRNNTSLSQVRSQQGLLLMIESIIGPSLKNKKFELQISGLLRNIWTYDSR